MRERIAVFLPDLVGGGAQRAMLKLANGIAGRGYPVDLVLSQAYGPFLPEISNKIRLRDLNTSRTLTSLPGLVHYLRSERPNAFVSALHYVNITAVIARYLSHVDTKLIISERSTLSVEARSSVNWRTSQLPKLARFFYPKADLVVTVSKGVADDLVSQIGLPELRVKVIYNPIVTPELKLRIQDTIDHPWYGARKVPVILSVGRLTEEKDFPILIRAFAQVRCNRPTKLLILGEGPQRNQLEKLVCQLGLENDVSLPGFVVNPYPYMVQASVFVLSSRREGLPGVLIEACYCGVSIVSTDCPSGPREILRDGKYGRLVSVGNVEELARAINEGLTGAIAPPPPESWHPYELDAVVDQYLEVLF